MLLKINKSAKTLNNSRNLSKLFWNLINSIPRLSDGLPISSPNLKQSSNVIRFPGRETVRPKKPETLTERSKSLAATSLEIQAENLRASESRVSDVDKASQLTKFNRKYIPSRAAVSSLAEFHNFSKITLRLHER